MTFPHSATIQRMTAIGTKFVYGTTGVTPCFLQPISAEVAQSYGLVVGKGSVAYLPSYAAVVDKDRLIIDGTTYGVKGVQHHQYGNLEHKKAVLEAI